MPDQRDKIIPVDPNLSVRQPGPQEESVRADQGPPPADYAERLESGAPLPGGQPLSGEQVADLLGQDDPASVTDTNRALQEAEGIDPDA